MIIAEIEGSILDTEIKNIAHGVNCQNAMGSGVAKVLFTKYPKIKREYHKLFTKVGNSKELLGTVQKITTKDKIIFNCFTQDKFGYDGKVYVSYSDVARCFQYLVDIGITEIAIPRIGCGLAGGDWEVVRELINKITDNKINVTVYYLT